MKNSLLSRIIVAALLAGVAVVPLLPAVAQTAPAAAKNKDTIIDAIFNELLEAWRKDSRPSIKAMSITKDNFLIIQGATTDGQVEIPLGEPYDVKYQKDIKITIDGQEYLMRHSIVIEQSAGKKVIVNDGRETNYAGYAFGTGEAAQEVTRLLKKLFEAARK